jgi:hypothetical protein
LQEVRLPSLLSPPYDCVTPLNSLLSPPMHLLPTPVERHTDSFQIVGWTTSATEPGFGGQRDDASIKARLINLVSSVRTLMRSTCTPLYTFYHLTDGRDEELETIDGLGLTLTYSTAHVHQHTHDSLPTRPRMIAAYTTRNE